MRIVVAAVLLGGCMTATDTPPAGGDPAATESYRAIGTEPFWSVTIAEGRMVYERAGEAGFAVARPEPQAIAGGRRYSATRLTLEITAAPCSDGMSDRRYPDTVTATVNGETLRGCGGEPLAPDGLAGTNWTIERIDGTPATAGRPATMAFDAARVSGSSGCNRFTGGYSMDGTALVLGAVAGTKMACPGPAMEQENRLFAILSGRIETRFEGGDTLVLTGAGGRTITLKRVI